MRVASASALAFITGLPLLLAAGLALLGHRGLLLHFPLLAAWALLLTVFGLKLGALI